jgi:hypothetical protein
MPDQVGLHPKGSSAWIWREAASHSSSSQPINVNEGQTALTGMRCPRRVGDRLAGELVAGG